MIQPTYLSRTVGAIRFEVASENLRWLHVWLDHSPWLASLENPQLSWLTARAGDVIVMNGERLPIKAVSLWRVHPAEERGRVVTCAADWLAGE